MESKGIKRTLGGLLAAGAELLTVVGTPETLTVVSEGLAGSVGGLGLVHALFAGTLFEKKLSGLASLLAAAGTIASLAIPGLGVTPFLFKMAGLLGAAGAGVSFTNR